MASLEILLSPLSRSSIYTSIKISMEVENALETLASTVTTLPKGIILPKATWFTEAVTTILRLCLLAAILAARSILAKSSPPNILPMGFVSLGRTKSVTMVRDSLGVLGVITKKFIKCGRKSREKGPVEGKKRKLLHF